MARAFKAAAVIAAVGAWLAVTPRFLQPQDPTQRTILLYDGVCNLCDGVVHFVADHDPQKNVVMGPIQRHPQLLQDFDAPGDLSTVVVIQDGQVYTHSTAALRILALLEAPYYLGSAFVVVPPFIRDFVYNRVAANRYLIFGKSDTCRAPDPDLQSRFLEPEVTSD
eukprot:INCI19180.1.p1 GENE.INCI19180.1~~INCI19180.1.p1  ORF type:complete len:166 (+),score=22.94 INCI19180.1:151-648(+)